jgi:transposase
MEGEKEAKLEWLLKRQKEVESIREWRRLEAVWLREKLGLSGVEVAEALHYRVQTVHLIWGEWSREQEALFQRRAPGGRKNAYLCEAEEQEFLQSFFEKAGAGELVTVVEIQAAFEKRVRQPVAPSTLYRMLHRHGWRKLAPRPRHPKSDLAKQAAAKKT